MSAAVTLLATAAATVGAVRVVRLVQRRMIAAERRLTRVRERQAARRDAPVLDLEAGADGVYGVAPPELQDERTPGGAPRGGQAEPAGGSPA